MTLSTGIEAVDRVLGGGIPPGSVIVLTSPPEAQVDPLLHASLHERPTHYFTTLRDTTAIAKELERLLQNPQIRSMTSVSLESGLDEILEHISDLESGDDVIVSVLDPLEAAATQNEYVSFLNHFVERLQETGSIGILHCLDDEDNPANRRFTLAAADFVWQLRTQRNGGKLNYTLEIPKAGGLELADDERVLALTLGREVTIDTSRDIA